MRTDGIGNTTSIAHEQAVLLIRQAKHAELQEYRDEWFRKSMLFLIAGVGLLFVNILLALVLDICQVPMRWFYVPVFCLGVPQGMFIGKLYDNMKKAAKHGLPDA